jgi:uncharacterized protein DUF6062
VKPLANVAAFQTEISDAFSKGTHGCALCSLWLDEEASLTEKIRAEGDSTDGELMEKVLTSSGFCNRHTHAVHKASQTGRADAPGCSTCARIAVKKFVEDLAPLIANLKGIRETSKEHLTAVIRQLGETISGDAMCPVCAELLESDRARITGLLQMLESRDSAELYGKSRAICMPHFVSAMQLVPRNAQKNVESVWTLLVRTELASLEWVDHLLNERMKKYSWDFRHEGLSPDEANAQKIAMLSIAGVEGLYCRPRKTSLRPAR